MKKLLILTLLSAFLFMQAAAQTGTITNISVQQRTDGSGLLDVLFSINGEGNSYRISLEASLDDGETYTAIDPAFLTGADGLFLPDSIHHIVWDGYGSFPDTYSEESILKIMAISVIGGGVPCPGMPSFTDERDNKTYNTVLIGNQCWMKENLNYVSDNSWCFEDNGIWCDLYGSLYSWDEAMAGASSSNTIPSGVQGVCPAGWHLPGNAEWDALQAYLLEMHEYPVSVAGNALKSCRQINSPLGGECDTELHPRWDEALFNPEDDPGDLNYGTDDFGFSALPAGARGYTGIWFELGQSAAWWSATQYDETTAHRWMLDVNQGTFNHHSPYKDNGFSVRCVKD